MKLKTTKLMLSTSTDGDVIVAEVKPTQARNRGEFFVSEDLVRLNVASGIFTDMTHKIDWGGRIFILTADLEV